MREASEITGYHAHIYFEPETRDLALVLREAISTQFTVEMGRVHDRPIGPHPVAMYQVAFETAEFARLVPWLMLNRSGLSVLVHPRTGDDLADHDTNPLWLGRALPIDLEVLRTLTAT